MKRGIKMTMAVGAIGIISLTGATFASAHPGDADSPIAGLKDRVAELLDIEREALDDAITQARQEIRSERMEARIQRAVDAGRLAQDEADALRGWLEARPAALNEIAPGMGGGQPGPLAHRGPHAPGVGVGPEQRLAQLVEDGVITQEEADEILAWQASRPDVLDELRPRERGGHPFHRGRGLRHGSHPFDGGHLGRFGGMDFEAPTPPADRARDEPTAEGTSL